MDRNGCIADEVADASRVALRKESVDRNMLLAASATRSTAVALRKESVDRNSYAAKSATEKIRSLSARRAWIEICGRFCWSTRRACRSPQGERG